MVFERKDKLKTTTKIANSFNMAKTTLFTIVKNKTKIMEAFKQSNSKLEENDGTPRCTKTLKATAEVD